jgi:hypothetical protein
VDSFAGSNATGEVAEALKRKWISLASSMRRGVCRHLHAQLAFRFDQLKFEAGFDEMPTKAWTSAPTTVWPVVG